MVFAIGLVVLVSSIFSGASSSPNSEFCQKMAIKDCVSKLNFFIRGTGGGSRGYLTKDQCQALQQTIDCLTVPRCPGDLLLSFESILLVTATMAKSSNVCPDLKYEKLLGQGVAMSCNRSKVQYDGCQRKCTCYEGGLIFCHRERKEFTTLNLDERRRFIDVLKTASKNPIYRDEYTRMTKIHSRIPSRLLHHVPQIFLPWHRWYLLEFENFLRQIDCRVTIPYWDWSKDSGHWGRATEIHDVWSPDPHGLGGDGVFPNGCVLDGPFREGEFFVSETVGNGCLKRDFNLACSLPGKNATEKAIEERNFTQFERTIRETFHPALHDCTGGHMSAHLMASFTPEFWIHHSFIDKLWSDWQNKGDEYKFQYFQNVAFEMPATSRFPWELLDNDNLPGDVMISYLDMEDNGKH